MRRFPREDVPVVIDDNGVQHPAGTRVRLPWGSGESGVPIPPHQWFHWLVLRGGTIIRAQLFLNRADALEAVGAARIDARRDTGRRMSRENVETLRRIITSFNGGDHDGALADFHPDVEWRDLMHAPDVPERVSGVRAIRAIWDQWEEAFDEFSLEVEEYVEVGDCVVTVDHWRAQGKGSGLALDLRTADVYEFKDRHIIRVTQGYPDKAAALAAVGLAE
jgi:ketosteroid isomerase-like protein